MTVTSLQLHCCPLLLNLNGFDLALQVVLVCFSLPGQRGRTFVRCRACRIHKQLRGRKGSQTEGGESGGGSSTAGGGRGGSGSPAAGGGGGGRTPETGPGGHGGESKYSSPAAGIDGGDGSVARQRAAAVEAAEAETWQQPQVVAEAKAKAAALQQAWMEAATAEARQQASAAQQAWAEAAAAAARQQAEEADAAVAAVTAEQQRIAEHTRARVELTAKLVRLLIGDHDVGIRRLLARIHP